MMGEHEGYGQRMDEVNDLGEAYEALQRGDQAGSPIRKSTYKFIRIYMTSMLGLLLSIIAFTAQGSLSFQACSFLNHRY